MEGGPYQELDGLNGIRIDNNEDWESAVYDLVDKPGKRRQIGRNAKQYVLSKYNINNHSDEWVKAYQSMYEKN